MFIVGQASILKCVIVCFHQYTYTGWVFQVLLYLGVSQKHITTTRSPQHTLEDW